MISMNLKKRLKQLRDYDMIKISFSGAGSGLLRLLVELKREWWKLGEDAITHAEIEKTLTTCNNSCTTPQGEYTIFLRVNPTDAYAASALLLAILSEKDIVVTNIV